MKKLTKRIIALMLSLVMILGCIPSFTNVVSAGEGDTINITYTPPTTKVEANRFAYDNDVECNKNGDPIYAWGIQLAYEPTLTNYNIVYLEVHVPFNDEASRNKVTTLNLNGENIKTAENEISSNYEEYKEQMKNRNFGWYTEDTASGHYLVSVQKIVFSEPITEVNLTSTGVLATNVKTLKYEVANDAPYTLADDPTTNWYKEEELENAYDFTTTGDAYKKIVLSPNSGYKFVDGATISLNGTGTIWGPGSLNGDGTLTVIIKATVQAGTISLDFEKPETLSDFNILDSDRNKFTMVGKDLDIQGGFDGIDVSQYTKNLNDRGFYYIWFNYTFTSSEDLNKIQHFIYRNKNLEIHDSFTENDLLSMNVGDIYCYKIDKTDQNPDNSKYNIIIYEKINFRKQATTTCPITSGTTVGAIKQAIVNSFATTASTTTGEISEDADGEKEIEVFNLTDIAELSDTDALESNKEYVVDFKITDTEAPVYSSIKVNNTTLTYFPDASSSEMQNNHFAITGSNELQAFYKFDTKQSSGGSKKYKATDDKDTAEKISGSGKKGSKRIVTPEPNRKVESVIVTDKDGNKYEVTNEGDGTYSFIQPGTNVDVEVKYKNRLIELTIGSLDASVDDIHHNLDVVPKVVNDRTMLPIRFVAENLGAKVDWDEKDPDTVIITRGETKIEITLGSDIAKVNGQEYMLDSVAFAENDRTYLPVRFVSEKLNAIVEWNEAHPMDVKIYERQ